MALGLFIPARPTRPGQEVLDELAQYVSEFVRQSGDETLRGAQILYIEDRLEELEPPLNRFVHLWHRWVAFGIVEEKSSRVVELLLSAVPARALLTGKIVGIGLLGVAQLAVLTVCGLLAGWTTGQLTLGAGLSVDGIDASYADGVLRLTIPMAEEAKPRKIQVAHSGEQATIEQSKTESAHA